MPQAREASIRPKAPPSPKGKPRKRMSYDPAFKLMVVKAALQRPQQNRIKPTCAHFPGIEPCQVGHSLLSGADRAGGARRAQRQFLPSRVAHPRAALAPPPRASTVLGVAAPTLDERLKLHRARSAPLGRKQGTTRPLTWVNLEGLSRPHARPEILCEKSCY